MTPSPTKEQIITEATTNLQNALLAELKADQAIEEAQRQKSKAHNDVLLAKEKLSNL